MRNGHGATGRGLFSTSFPIPGWSAVLSVRPKVAELSFHVFTRALHPELYRVHAGREVERGDYRARIEITDCGHVVTLRRPCGIITEIAAARSQPLPTTRCKLRHRLTGSRTDRLQLCDDVEYRTHFQLETVKPELFFMMHKQLSGGATSGLLHHFDTSVRSPFAPLSYVNIETRSRSLRLQAVHTFPADFAIVKVESLFSMPTDD